MWSATSHNLVESQGQLVSHLIRSGSIVSEAVANAFKLVNRLNFVPVEFQSSAYEDRPLPIGHNQTISAPHIHAYALELILPVFQSQTPSTTDAIRILDVGCGSGYFTALLAVASPPHSTVFAVDCYPELVEGTRLACLAQGLPSSKVKTFLGDGWKGLPDAAPFNVIHVGAGAATIPTALLAQLKLGGKLIIPVGTLDAGQTLLEIERIRNDDNGTVPLSGSADIIHYDPWVNRVLVSKSESASNTTHTDMDCFRVTPHVGVAFVPLIPDPHSTEVAKDAGAQGKSRSRSASPLSKA